MSARSHGTRRRARLSADRRAPGLGGLNLTILAWRSGGSPATGAPSSSRVVVPIALFLLVGLNKTYVGQPDGEGNVSAFIMISISLYGAALPPRPAARWCPSSGPPAGAASSG